MTTTEKIRKATGSVHDDITISEIRNAVAGESTSFDGIEKFIRIQKKYGRSNGTVNKSAAMGAKYEYYGLKNGKIVKTPFFAPDQRYFKLTGNNKCTCLELEDEAELSKNTKKINAKKNNSTSVFRSRFPGKAKKYDAKHGENNWWAEGTVKNGFELFFKN